MEISCWIKNCADNNGHEQLSEQLLQQGVNLDSYNENLPNKPGICIFHELTAELCDFLQTTSRGGRERIIVISDSAGLRNGVWAWKLLQAGASDVLTWSDADTLARQVRSRFERWLIVDQLVEMPIVTDSIVGKSPVWRTILQEIIETSRFSEAPMLILGESGTGKELIARLIHMLDGRSAKGDFVILDCSTIVPELSGSEFFGHERGAFTGAVSERDGAFALANEGTLFLDEIGELPMSLQTQLLRVVQEGSYKRVGGNTWQKTRFRLVCATNRDLLQQVQCGEFRADLFYRIASFVCRLPPLRERREDVIPLAEFFLRELCPDEPPKLDESVREYLLRREYPGNVRELRQAILRLLYRYAGGGKITIGNVPPEDRPAAEQDFTIWRDGHFERVIHRALLHGAGLKEIGRAAEDIAIRLATDEESGNIQRAARRLGVTDRALQLRRANRRQIE